MDYKILLGDAATPQDFDILIMVESKNMAALDGLREKTDPIARKIMGTTRSTARHTDEAAGNSRDHGQQEHARNYAEVIPRARAFRSRCQLHRKRELQHRVSGCKTLRTRLHC